MIPGANGTDANGSGALHAGLNLGDAVPSSAKITITQDAPQHEGAVPIQLPTIFINPYVAPKEEPKRALPTVPAAPATASPTVPRESGTPKPKATKGDAKFVAAAVQPVVQLWERRPHPLLWVTLGLSIVALVLGVPKGSLPTVTGRHKALRVSFPQS